MATKMKPLGPKEAVGEQRLIASRSALKEEEVEASIHKAEGQSMQDKLGMIAFLLVSLVIMYLTMTPNRKV